TVRIKTASYSEGAVAMSTPHTARRRPRPVGRKTNAASPRGRHTVGARQNRTAAQQPVAITSAPTPVIGEPVRETPPQPRAVRAPDADDHLAAYFRQLAEHELLSPEDERELSQGIEDTEILTWERVLARPEVVRPLLALVEPNLERPVKFPK